ncbi:MAG: hypothetical protein JNL79_18650 [Myxococcales bacterium]|nr:hypothetical protein [Myxococcales bacterium]
MSHGFTPHKTGNAILDNPGIVASVFTAVVLFGFVFLVVTSGGGHGAGHGGAHGAASGSAAHSAAPAASGSASAAAPVAAPH